MDFHSPTTFDRDFTGRGIDASSPVSGSTHQLAKGAALDIPIIREICAGNALG
jgi:hypothetical protein